MPTLITTTYNHDILVQDDANYISEMMNKDYLCLTRYKWWYEDTSDEDRKFKILTRYIKEIKHIE